MRLFWSTAAVSVMLGVLAARLASASLSRRIPVLGDFAGLELSFNPGIAWGMRLPSGIQEAAIGVALIVVIVLAYRENGRMAKWPNGQPTIQPSSHSTITTAAYGLIVGGGIANIIDRFGDGVVTDYFQVGTFPVFNVADSCVTIGVALLLLEAFLRPKSV